MTATTATAAVDLDAVIRLECGKCSGTGTVSWGIDVVAQFTNEAGRVVRTVPKVCFDCKGYGYTNTTQRKLNANEKSRARYAAKKEAERVAKVSARDAARDAWKAENADVVAALATLSGSFAESMRESLEAYGSLTANQSAAITRQAAEKASAPEATPVIAGRGVITGKIISSKPVESMYGTTWKMLVQDDRGFKVWGTVPSSLPTVDRGTRVTFTATVEKSEDDETFGFYSRPTKAAVLAA